MIKNIIGYFTLPKKVYDDELGYLYIETSYVPKFDETWYNTRDYSHKFNYRRLKQNWYGNYELQEEWIGINEELKLYENKLNLDITYTKKMILLVLISLVITYIIHIPSIHFGIVYPLYLPMILGFVTGWITWTILDKLIK